MKRFALNFILAASAFAVPAIIGCDKTPSENTKADGEVVTDKETTTQTPDGGTKATTTTTSGISRKEVAMKGFVQNIEDVAVKNEAFRRVLYTAKNCQLVVMSLKPGEEIGAEVHHLDQFFRVEEGTGEAILDGVRTPIRAGFAVLVPAGTNHNIINSGNVALKLYTLYAPPNHRDGVVHRTRGDAEADNEHFDGRTTE